MSSGGWKAGRLAFTVSVAGMACYWLYAGLTVATSPQDAPIPDDEYRQYIAGWPSGTGIAETVSYLREQARRPGKPLLVSVGAFGRHGSWAIKPRLAGEPGIQFREEFVDSPAVFAALALAARDHRVFIVDEPPAYSVTKEIMALGDPAPKVVFKFDRAIPRLGTTDGSLQVWEIHRRTRVRLPFAGGAPVSPEEAPVIESLLNPNGMEGTREQPFFWIGAGATEMVVRSGRKGVLRLDGEFRSGPSVTGKGTRELLVATSGGYEEVVELGLGRATLLVPVEAGRTRIQLIGLDAKNVPMMKNGDARPLILGVEGLHIAGLTESGGSSGRCEVAITGGAYGVEKMGNGPGWFRWAKKEVEIRLFSSRGGTIVLDGEYLSNVRPAKLELLLNDEPAGVISVGPRQDKMQGLPSLRLKVPAGSSTLVMRSGSEGTQPRGDARVLNFLVGNLHGKLEGVGPECAVRP